MTMPVDAKWSGDNETGLTFRSDAPIFDFIEVLVDGNVIAPEHYVVREGSTIVELKPSFLETLPKGNHAITIRSQSGDATAKFAVEQAEVFPAEPQVFPWTWLIVAAVVLVADAVVAATFLRRRKKT